MIIMEIISIMMTITIITNLQKIKMRNLKNSLETEETKK
jgi:hypothetical protein